MSKCSLVDGLKDCLDDVLGIADDIGATLHDVFILTRTWDGAEVGAGGATDSIEQVLPTPEIKDYSHDLRLREGGNVKQGDIILRSISKNKYPAESQVDCSTNSHTVEKFYLINDRLYNVIHVKENLLTWDVHIRKIVNERRY